MRRAIIFWAIFAGVAAGQVREDTARMAVHLKRFRGFKGHDLQTDEFKTIQTELLGWADTRLREGKRGSAMTAELMAAGLLSDGPQTIDDEFNRTYAGYFGGVSTAVIPEAPDLLQVTLDIWTGGYCNIDTTVVLYTRSPFRRIAVINAEPAYSHGSHLRTLTVGKADPEGRRIIGTAWVASNCTSNWNGENFRIDRISDSKLTPIANHEIGAFFGDPVTITLNGSALTVQYSMHDGQAHLIPILERYRIDGDSLTRLTNPPR